MTLRTKIGLYGSYLMSMASIGFTLPYLPLYLREEGLSDQTIGLITMAAAISGLAQFPLGVWSDRLGGRKFFLVTAVSILAAATWLLPETHSPLWLGLLVVLFAENGICRAVIESLSGAEAAAQAEQGHVGSALGALRVCKPLGIVAVALVGGMFAESHGVAALLGPMMALHVGAVFCSLLLPEAETTPFKPVFRQSTTTASSSPPSVSIWRDRALWIFVAAMVLFHFANAPGGTFLGLFLNQDLQAPQRLLSYAFAISMLAWMLVVVPGGKLADRWGTRPLLIVCWAGMALRLGLVSVARSPWEVVGIQFLDGFSNGLFAVLAASWVTERINDKRRVGEAQAIVGTSLVLGSGLGPAFAGWIVEGLGYRAMFGILAAIGAIATLIVAMFIPESVRPSLQVKNYNESEADTLLAESVLPR